MDDRTSHWCHPVHHKAHFEWFAKKHPKYKIAGIDPIFDTRPLNIKSKIKEQTYKKAKGLKFDQKVIDEGKKKVDDYYTELAQNPEKYFLGQAFIVFKKPKSS